MEIESNVVNDGIALGKNHNFPTQTDSEKRHTNQTTNIVVVEAPTASAAAIVATTKTSQNKNSHNNEQITNTVKVVDSVCVRVFDMARR